MTSPRGHARPGGPPQPEVEALLRQAFQLLGIGNQDAEGARTAERVARLYRELFWGLDPSGAPEISLLPHRGQEPVILRDIPFYSMCVHHLLPFFGWAAVGYRPEGQVAGLSTIVEVIEYFAARPQLQERLAEQIADYLQEHLQPRGLVVWLRARHMCVEMRGPSRQAWVECLASRGCLVSGTDRGELLRLLGHPAT